MSGVYNFNDYDKYLSLKVSTELWVVILYLLRPYIIMLSALRMGRGGSGAKGASGLKDLVYPDDFSLALAILATIPVMVFMYAWSKRKPGAKPLVKKLWSRGKLILTTAAVLNILVVFVPLLTMVTHKVGVLGWVQVVIAILIIAYLHFSQREKDTFADFPKEEGTDEAR